MRAEEGLMCFSMQVSLSAGWFGGFVFPRGSPQFPFGPVNVSLTAAFSRGVMAQPCTALSHGIPSMDAVTPLSPQSRKELRQFCLHSKHWQVFEGSVFIQVFGKAQSVPAMAPGGSGPGFLPWNTTQPTAALGGFGTRHLPSPSAWMEFWELCTEVLAQVRCRAEGQWQGQLFYPGLNTELAPVEPGRSFHVAFIELSRKKKP